MQNDILTPFFGMMMLTFIVWLYMYVKRLGYISRHQVDVQAIATPEAIIMHLPEEVNGPSNNLKNLFELPVLFYGVCLYLYLTGQVDTLHIYCAYGFFILRAVHSAIHCTINIVLLRFTVYLVSAIPLWTMIIRCFVEVALTEI